MTPRNLIEKYDVPVPRYTSYPTVPAWDNEHFSISQWMRTVEQTFDESNNIKGISLYIHLPFCESLCTYCACNTHITVNHAVEEKYIENLVAEWELYRYIFGRTPILRELHLGGGTPTFFSPENLMSLLSQLLSTMIIHPDHDFSFEGHPNNTTKEHLEVLYALGFRRVSYGVQDLDETVQKAIHRIQPFYNLEKVTALSKVIGFESINFDLLYGLPFQNIETVSNTFRKLVRLRPGRISFYSYAHVPWISPGQRGYEDLNLPDAVTKRALYNTGRDILLTEGYRDIGMDHFALPSDTLFQAVTNGKLHRNFMGYTNSQTDLLIGLGASAISDAKYAFAQNAKKVNVYQDKARKNMLPVFKGHLHTEEDMRIRQYILDIACRGEIKDKHFLNTQPGAVLTALKKMEDEQIIELTDDGLKVTHTGKPFIRNICHVLDARLRKEMHATPLFSKAI